MKPQNLYEYYTGQGKALPKTAAERFADPSFAAAAKAAGYDANSYQVNAGNAAANTAILANLMKGGTTAGVGSGTTGAGTGTGTTPTIGAVYNLPTQQESPEMAAARAAAGNFAKNQAGGIPNVDEAAIRAATLAQFQAEIDATNTLYAEKLRQAKLTGAGRIGSGTAIQARRGLIGSDFGAAETDRINTDNNQIYGGIEAEKAARINAILTKSNDTATQTIAAKTKAIAEGLDAHLKYLSEAGERKTTNAEKAAQFIYSQKLEPKDLTADELKKTAEGYGVTADDIKNAYTNVKKKGDEEIAKKAAEDEKARKAGLTIIPQGSKVIDADGKEVAQGNPKTFAPKSPTTKAPVGVVRSGKATFTPEQMSDFSAELEASKKLFGGDGKYVNPDVYLEAYNAWTDPEVGGLAKDFLLKFPPAKYVNPANNTLPDYLRSKKAAVPKAPAGTPTTPAGGRSID